MRENSAALPASARLLTNIGQSAGLVSFVHIFKLKRNKFDTVCEQWPTFSVGGAGDAGSSWVMR